MYIVCDSRILYNMYFSETNKWRWLSALKITIVLCFCLGQYLLCLTKRQKHSCLFSFTYMSLWTNTFKSLASCGLCLILDPINLSGILYLQQLKLSYSKLAVTSTYTFWCYYSGLVVFKFNFCLHLQVILIISWLLQNDQTDFHVRV